MLVFLRHRCSGDRPMPRLVVALLLITAVGPGAALAQQPDDSQLSRLSAEQLEAEIKRLHGEIEALRRSPAAPAEWKYRLQLEAQLAQMRQQRHGEQAPLQEKLNEVSKLRSVQAWSEQIAQLEKRLQAVHVADHALFRSAGRHLFQARHAELAKAAPAQTPKLRELGLVVLNYPRMDGSTSTQPLATLIACRCFGASYTWVGREQALPRRSRLDPTLPINEERRLMERFYARAEPELKLLEFTLRAKTDTPASERLGTIINGLLATNASTHAAYVNLIDGRSDIGLLARGPSADELQLAREKKVELETAPCARDAFVFLVNEKNPVKNLTTAQIRAIYSGQTRNWQSVGGPDERIVPYQREENSGSQELMRRLVMKEVPLMKPESKYDLQLVGNLMGSTFLELTGDETGIGYSVYYYEQFMSGSPRTRTIAVDGVAPSYDSIRERKYPYISDVLVVTRKNIDAKSPAKRLRDWLLSAEGQAIVRESGYVPLASGHER
jgi:phosphate transport system substrate-binding protein